MKTSFYLKVITVLLILQFVSLPAGAAVYTYDELNRLTSVVYDFGQEVTYIYDADGNILSVVMSEDTTAPTVSGTDPADGATEVPVSKTITVTFNETVTEGVYFDGITVKNTVDNSVVDYTYSVNDNILSIEPVIDLAYGVSYNVTLPAGAVKDASGNALTNPYSFNFTTIAADTSAPTVVSTDPPDSATGVPVSKTIIVTFNETVAQGVYFDDFTVENTVDNSVVGYTYSINGNTLSIDPVNNLAYGAGYNVIIPAGAVKDSSGNALANQYSFNFTAQAAPDTAPTVVNTDPPDGAIDVPLSKTVTVAFSEDIQVGNTFDNIIIVDNKNGDPAVTTKHINGSTLLLDPDSDLTKSHSFTVTIPAGAVWDNTGNALASEYSFTFATAKR